MANGILSKLFKSSKDKKDAHHQKHTPLVQSSVSPISSTSGHPNDAHSSYPGSSPTLKTDSASTKLEAPHSVKMRSSGSSTSSIHPIDSNPSPHLKLARFLEKRHLKHQEFLDSLQGKHKNNKSKTDSPKKSYFFQSKKAENHVHHKEKPLQKTQNLPSKFNDFNALTQLVAPYGIIPDRSVDLMALLEHTNIENQPLDAQLGSLALNAIDVPKSGSSSNALIIGKGAGGSVYPLYDSTRNHLYAIKKLRLQMNKEDWFTYQSKLKNEFNIAKKLHHQNLIRTYDLLQDNDLFIIVMDYAPYDFFTMVMAGKFTKYECYCYLRQLCEGVCYMHSIGLAHRDLKLDNCVVDQNGVLKIVDFGSSVIFDQKLYDGKGKSRDIDQASGILGSDPYLAPEVVQYPFYDPSLADVWSVAIIYCCMVLRRFPWRIPKTSDTAYDYFTRPTGEITDSNGQVKQVGPEKLFKMLPHSSRPVIAQMLKIRPSERASMKQVLDTEFMQNIEYCHYEEYDAERNTGIIIKAQNHTHHLITNKQFEDENPEEAAKEKEREEMARKKREQEEEEKSKTIKVPVA